MSVQELIFTLAETRNKPTDQVLIYDKFHEEYKNIECVYLEDETIVIHTF